MRNDELHSFFDAAKSISLTEQEHEEARYAIIASQASAVGTFSLDPNEKAAFRLDLLKKIRGPEPKAVPAWRSFLFLPLFRFPLLTSLVFLTIIGSGKMLMVAADDALPGDILYPVKLNITEVMVNSFLSTPEAQAAWAITTVERRLEEIRQKSELAVTEEDDKHYAELVEQYAEIADVQVSRASTATAEALRNELEVTLAVEERRLIRQAELRPSRHMLQTVRTLREKAERRRQTETDARENGLRQAAPPPAASESEESESQEQGSSSSQSGATTT